jgi:hypothetical protein
MKGKIIRGSGFGGVLNYVLDEDKEARIVGGNMTGQDARALAREFGHVRRLRPDCGKPGLHIPLRLPEGEDVSDARWLEIALFFMKLMSLSPNRPWVIVKHVKNHVHLITGRVDHRGKIWTGKWEGLRCIQATQEIERHFGLTITPGLKGRDKKQVRLTSGQLRKMQRELDRGKEPEVPAKVAIAERIEQAIIKSDGTFDGFKAQLEKLGVATRLNVAKTTNHISGISFEFGGIVIKGSKVTRAYSWQGLSQLLAERKENYENPGVAQPNIQPCPQSDDHRANQPKPASFGQRTGPARNRPTTGSVPTPPPVPLAVRGDNHDSADVVLDLLLALLGKPPVATAVGAIAGSACPSAGAIISTAGKVDALRRRSAQASAEDDEPAPEPDEPTMSF